jgi:hypothetical protein
VACRERLCKAAQVNPVDPSRAWLGSLYMFQIDDSRAVYVNEILFGQLSFPFLHRFQHRSNLSLANADFSIVSGHSYAGYRADPQEPGPAL